ncbi:MAG TPA: hypothetical protein VGR50_00220 [Terriglobales bacterium]|nr:hypothetical protein [Terriglobales bacterium]
MDAVIAGLVQILEAVFLVGIAGSALVILMSGIEDIETIFEPDEVPPATVTRNPAPPPE